MRNKIHANVYFFFLPFLQFVVIINNNAAHSAVMCGSTKVYPKPCHRRALFVIPRGEFVMAVSYKKLWKLLIDKDIKKKDLIAKAKISPATITKMGKNGHVTTEVLLKICTALDCQVDDIMEIVTTPQQ